MVHARLLVRGLRIHKRRKKITVVLFLTTDGLRRVPAELLSVRQLSLSEAMRFYASEGFSSPEKFLENIKSIYPHLKHTDKVNLIEFRLK